MLQTITKILVLCVLGPMLCGATTTTLNVSAAHVTAIHAGVLNTYNSEVLPASDNSAALDVNIEFSINGITGFDEVAGVLIVVGVMNTTWTSAALTWTPASYDSVGRITLQQSDIWTPPLTLFNGMEKIAQIGDKKFKVHINYDGYTIWAPPVLLSCGCSVNVLYFPYDVQNCSIEIIPWQYLTTEIALKTSDTVPNLDAYEENMTWDIFSSTAEILEVNGKSMYKVTLILRRRPLYHTIILIIPVVLLGFLAAFTFYIPIEEGRVGFAMNAFLTFSVFLILIGDNIPKSSDPMSLLSWYVVCQVGLAGFSTFLCIVVVRWHVKEEEIEVPHCVMTIAAIMSCKVCMNPNKIRAPTKILPLRERDPHAWINIHGNTFKMLDQNQIPTGIKFGAPNQKWKTIEEKEEIDMDYSELCYVPKVSWVTVAKTFDSFFFFLFLLGQVGIGAVFLVPICTNNA